MLQCLDAGRSHKTAKAPRNSFLFVVWTLEERIIFKKKSEQKEVVFNFQIFSDMHIHGVRSYTMRKKSPASFDELSRKVPWTSSKNLT